VEVQWQKEAERITSQGILQEVNPDSIVIKDNEDIVEIPFSTIHKARTCFSDGRKKGKK
jgi:ribosome maturation factor RimP